MGSNNSRLGPVVESLTRKQDIGMVYKMTFFYCAYLETSNVLVLRILSDNITCWKSWTSQNLGNVQKATKRQQQEQKGGKNSAEIGSVEFWRKKSRMKGTED